MKEIDLLLKKNIFSRATYFIEDMNHFVPFGANLLNDDTIKDVVMENESDTGNDIILGEKLISILKKNFSKDITDKKIQAGAIAYDVSANFQNSDGMYEKRDALCLIISIDGENWTEEYFPYMLIEGKCIWR